jgi:TolB protein
MVQGCRVEPWPAVVVLLAALAAPAASLAATRGRALGDFEAHADVGSPRQAGAATYNAASQEYRLTAAGTNMWGARDEFHFAWRKLSGDFVLQARVELLGKGVDPHRKAGWIVRTSLDEDSPHAAATVHGDGLTSLQYRRAKGAPTEEARSTVSGADVIQLERRGGTLTFSAAKYGEPFSDTRLADPGLGDAVYVGLFLCSHNPDVLESAVFRGVRIVRPAPTGFVPYRDYIGSRLEILDVESGHRQVLLSSPEPFEAPNWTPDGAALVYNTSGRSEGRGRLRRFDLATRQSAPIDTGFAIRNNNDHVLSFDGTMLGISDQSSPGGESTIFTLPAAGGTPRRITPLTPSYLHGWSPDGRFLVYTGGRNGEYDIYRIPADGSGPEVRLTDHKGLDDGPEYSPDGRYIYFNSTRGGRMQIWRMKPDGREPEAVTSDGLNNWFPHLSPDGRWIAFLSYGADVDPSDHPYYRHVYIRVMPAAGGPARVVAYVYGGQGTINVPSWSPDGTMLAFVSNSAMDYSRHAAVGQ